MTELLPLVVHLASGEQLPVELPVDDDEDTEDVMRNLCERFQPKPAWVLLGDVLLFSGAVSAIHPT